MAKYVRNKRSGVIPSSALSAFVYQSISASLSLSLFLSSTLTLSLSLSFCPPVSLRHQTESHGGEGGGVVLVMMLVVVVEGTQAGIKT